MAVRSCLDNKLVNRNRAVRFYGVVPPRSGSAADLVDRMVGGLVKTVETLRPDGVMIYDVQDEPSRSVDKQGNPIPRPFPFSASMLPEEFATEVRKNLQLQGANDQGTAQAAQPSLVDEVGIILYKCVTAIPKENFPTWIDAIMRDGTIQGLTVVGAPSSAHEIGTTVSEACEIVKSRSAEDLTSPVALGGIMLPERNKTKRDEHLRLHSKSEAGVGFFTTQVVYTPDNVICVMRNYAKHCRDVGAEPSRLVFCFAPFGRPDTMVFLRWLGVEIPEAVEHRITSAATVEEAVAESVRICTENLRTILRANVEYGYNLPIGFTVESVSRFKVEITAVETLYHSLTQVLNEFGLLA